MKQKQDTKIECDYCGVSTAAAKITRVGYRYTSKTKKYAATGRNFFITGYKFVCPACMSYFK